MAKSKPDPLNDFPIHPRPGVDPTVKRYGRFDPASREYVITRPDTPQPWYNYITNGSFTGYVSQTGGGMCFAEDPRERRVLRAHFHGRPADQPGRWIYIRDRATGTFHAATWAPVFTPLTRFKYEARVGTGYTTVRSVCGGIETAVTYFVPPDAQAEIWRVRITNVSKTARRLDVFPFAEFVYFSVIRDENLDAAFKCTDVVPMERMILHRSRYDWGADRGGWQRQFAWFASSTAPASVDVRLDAFVGTYRGYDRPLAVEAGKCSGFASRGGEPIATMQIPLNLKAGESRDLVFAVGYSHTQAAAKREAAKVATAQFADRQFAKLTSHWRDYLDRFQAETPEPCSAVPFNTFAPLQNAMTFLLSRSISPYQLGAGRGLGFRDSNQDTLGAMAHEPPAKPRALIQLLLGTMYESGEASHDFKPHSGEGSGGGCWDDHLWPALSVEAYVKETGDLAFLDEPVGFVDGDERSGVLDHLLRALTFTENHLGANGLPLLGEADWNDGLNAFDGAESVFTAALYCAALHSVAALCNARGEKAKARGCLRRHEKMAERMNAVAWDGAWYSRMITAEGDVVGSRKNRYGRIFIESNVWAVLSGAAPPERARKALDSVRKHLGTPYGFKLCQPPYPDYDPAVGTLTVFAPGEKENGAIFCHTNPWLILAEAALGRGAMAFDAFRRISPWTKDRIQSIHCAEPYVINQMIVMPPSLEAGRARNPWLTGTASWFLYAMQQGILGVRPDFAGLRIDPCVPGWRRFGIRRVFRGVTYDIHVENPSRVEHGVAELRVNGNLVEGNLIPPPEGRRRKPVRVDVRMGAV